jgi:asparagine synthase (glutamine-hydrolysing)
MGARVALDGNGGDQLFQVSSRLPDLLRSARVLELAREWRAEGGGGVRALYAAAVRPHLTDGVPRRTVPAWIDPRIAKGLAEREALHTRVGGAASLAARESRWYVTRPLFPRMSAALASFALEYGVEHRSPLYDQRLVELAATRPAAERRSFGETKLLLRRAMRGLLPDAFLAPRAHRTGIPIHYLLRSVHASVAAMDDGPLLLAELGIADGDAVRAAAARFTSNPTVAAGAQLFYTLSAERWVREHTAGEHPARPKRPVARLPRRAASPAPTALRGALP